MASTRFLVPVLVLPLGCFNPSDSGGSGSTGATDTDPSATSETTPTQTTATATAPTTVTMSTTDSTTDAPTTSVDTGSTTTPTEECGNGEQEGDEECDDGDTEPGDGCSGVCLDENDACQPELVGSYSAISNIGKMVADDNYLYIIHTGGAVALTILDISDPALVSEEATMDATEFDPTYVPLRIDKRGDAVFLGGFMPDFAVVDVTTPSSPMLVFNEGNGDADGSFGIDGTHLARSIPPDDEGFIYDIGDPLVPDFVTFVPTLDRNAGGGGGFFTAVANTVFSVHDASDPPNTTLTGQYTHPVVLEPVNASAANTNAAFIASEGDSPGIVIIDLSLPTAPDLASEINADFYPDLALKDGFLFLPFTDGLQVYDVSVPGDPELAGSFLEVEAFGVSVAVNDEYAFLNADGSEIRIIAELPGTCASQCGNSVVEYPEDCDDGNADDADTCPNDCEDSDE